MPRKLNIGVQPKWLTVPTLNFTSGTASSVNLASYVYNPRGYPLTFSVASGAPPTGLSISGNLLQWDGRLVDASSTSITLRLTTSVNSAVSNSTTVAVALGADVNAPSVPTGLAISNITSNSLTLSWGASTDPTVTGRTTSGLSGYTVFRNGTPRASIAAPTTTFSDTGLTASTQYTYTVAAIDNAGNNSAQSAQANATTQALSVLTISANKRYLQDANGTPFFLHGDTAWSIVGQLTNAEIDTYLNDRQAKGFNAILFSAPEAYYTNQTPAYNNVNGVAPFNPATSFTNPVEAYWTRVDYLVNGAKSRGMVCIINPCYWGYLGNDGWGQYLGSVSNATLQAYGAWLASRYTQGNIIWSMGGDRDDATDIAKQWNVITGIRSIRTTDIITAHPLSDAANADDAYTYWSGFTGFNLNWTYGYEDNGFYAYELAQQGYTRPIPFLGTEFRYEQEGAGTDAARLRRQSYTAILGGACGQVFGNNPIWHFGSSRTLYPYTGTWQTNLGSIGSTQQQYVKALFTAYNWHLLQPKTDTSLVTTSLGADAARICPARASDGSFAMVYVPTAQSITVAMTQLTPSLVRARWYDPTNGTYSTIGTYANSGTQTFAAPGERVLVLDNDASAARVSWTAPTTNTAGQSFDGTSADRTLVGHRIYYGTNLSQVTAGTSAYVDVGMPALSYIVTGLTSGPWYFRVVARDGDGDESSNVDTYTKVIP